MPPPGAGAGRTPTPHPQRPSEHPPVALGPTCEICILALLPRGWGGVGGGFEAAFSRKQSQAQKGTCLWTH